MATALESVTDQSNGFEERPMATMDSVTVDAAVAAMGMPRLGDGTVSLMGLGRALLGQVVNEVMRAMAEAGEDAGTSRNGHRDRRLETAVGTPELGIPKLGAGTFFPQDLLERHSRTDKAMAAAISEMYAGGLSTRRVEAAARALGVDSPGRDQAGRICRALDAAVEDPDGRALGGLGDFPYMWLDATYARCRDEGRVASAAVVTAIGCDGRGMRYVLGFDVVDTESYDSWLGFLRALRDRGVGGVRLVVSDAHKGLVRAIGEVFQGAAWQRCVVHLIRDCCRAARSRDKRARIADEG